MQLLVNGSLVGSVEVKATAYTDYPFSLNSAVAPGARIDVVFANDGTVNGADRNLYVDSVRVNGATLHPSDAGVTLDTGSGAAAFDGVNVSAGRSDILWSAALRFKAPGDSLVVRARGSMAGGVGPTMQVLVDGAAVGSVEVKASAYADYSFALKTLPSQRVDIVFLNDGAAGTATRNELMASRCVSLGACGHTKRSVDRYRHGAAAFDGVNVIPGQAFWECGAAPTGERQSQGGSAQLATRPRAAHRAAYRATHRAAHRAAPSRRERLTSGPQVPAATAASTTRRRSPLPSPPPSPSAWRCTCRRACAPTAM
jgi:hypothetical protein